MAALHGVRRTVVGYCGGVRPDPTYRRVCADPSYSDYAEALHVDYDPSLLSYTDVLDAFFLAHDALSGGRSRQYSSIIFTHSEEQAELAADALAARPRASTAVERAAPFWEAEPYHQKWLLQRKRDLMLALGMEAVDELTGEAATIVNAVASGNLRGRVALQRLEPLMASGQLSPGAHGSLAALLDPLM